MDIYFRVAFKPVSTLMKEQKSIDVSGQEVILEGKGRHDACVLPRAVPVVEAMTALVLADMYLLNKKIQNFKDEKARFALEDNYRNGLGLYHGLFS